MSKSSDSQLADAIQNEVNNSGNYGGQKYSVSVVDDSTGSRDSLSFGGDFGKGDGNTNSNGSSGSKGGKTLNSIPGFPKVVDYGPQGFGSDWHRYITLIRDAAVMLVAYRGDGQIQGYVEQEPIKKNTLSWSEKKSIAVQQINEFRNAEKSTLLGASAIIADAGEKISVHIGGQYRNYSREIASNISNFQGKTIRSYNDAMVSLNKLMANPSMKVKQGDRKALANALRSVNANEMANRLGHFGKFFKAADLVVKIEKVREKSIVGYETGDWGPLMYETEAMVMSGLAGSVAMSLVASILSAFALPALLATSLSVVAFIAIAYATSFIDAAFAERFNNQVVRPAN